MDADPPARDAAARLQPLVVPARFAGPPGSANGGYAAGLLARYLVDDRLGEGTAVEVTLRQPPPLDLPLVVSEEADDDGPLVVARFGGAVVAEARPATLTTDAVDPVSYPVARQAAEQYEGIEGHPFPGCFVCGTDRPAPDGLGLRPGPAPGRAGTTASAWVPDPSQAEDGKVPVPVVWAALDCPGGWSLGLTGRPAVLGRITARVDALPEVGDRCVVMGRSAGRQGRKGFSDTTLYDGDGRVLARARAVWVEVDPARVGRR